MLTKNLQTSTFTVQLKYVPVGKINSKFQFGVQIADYCAFWRQLGQERCFECMIFMKWNLLKSTWHLKNIHLKNYTILHVSKNQEITHMLAWRLPCNCDLRINDSPLPYWLVYQGIQMNKQSTVVTSACLEKVITNNLCFYSSQPDVFA